MMQKEMIYAKMNGFLAEGAFPVLKGFTIEDEFADGKECSRLYERAYQAKENLCRRLGKEEDDDIEILMDSMEDMVRYLSMKMYEYGKNEHQMKVSY